MSIISSTQVPEVTIRQATSADADGLRRLAQRDSAQVPASPLVIGEIDGEIRAAVAIADGSAIADPFTGTADVIALLQARADQVRRRRRRPVRIVARTPAPARALRRQAA